MRICITTCTIIFILTLLSYASNTYTVKQGDTLYDIAVRHNTSVDKIKDLNNLGSSSLSLGQTIELPQTFSTYKIRNGDTLGSIAVKHGLSSSKDLIKFNKLKNSRIRVGQVIKIPSSQPNNELDKNNSKKIQIISVQITHTVKEKETLFEIARMHGSDVEKIKAENSLKDNSLKPGQKLIIPPAVKTVAETKKAVSGTYTVKSGDTLGQIAVKHGLNSSKDLIAANNLKNSRLSVGQVLIIPVKEVAPVKSNSVKLHSFPTAEQNTAKLTFETNNKEIDQSKPVTFTTQIRQEKIEQPKNNNKEEVITYKVKSGDTLGQIAVKYELSSSREIIEFNSLQNSKLSIGQVIKIPSVDSKSSAAVQIKPVQVKEDKIQITHTVKSGESLYAIAKMHGSSVDKIKAENRLTGNKLNIGQKLIIPPSGKNIQVVKTEVKTTAPKNESEPKTVSKKKEFIGTYKVRSGDTLSQIAEKFSVRTSELKEANNLRGNNIRVGQKLSVPNTPAANIKTAKVSKPKIQTYTVKKGDTLIGIAKKYGTNVAALTNYNKLNSLTLKVGDKLQIPDKSFKYTKSGNINYRVKRGDTLSTIARNFNVTVSSIKAANGLRSSRINIGTNLTIPTAKKNTTIVKHTVRRGDTLSSIARKHRSSVSSIKSANNLRSSYIRPGQKLKVPSTVNRYVTTVRVPKKSKIDPKLYTNDFDTKNELVNIAKKYLGAPYKFGGTSTRTGIDCSAYVNKVYGFFDVNLPRTARDIYKKGHWVSKGKLQKGDLVFFTTYAKFPSHVGIYIGNNKFIHASSASKRVTITNINKNYYKKRYIGAKRISIDNVYAKNTP